jgi:hypothetical protein
LTVWAAAGNTAQHEETEVVGVDGSGAINHLACLVVVIKGLAHGVDIVTEGLAKALSHHHVLQEGQGASKRPAVEAFTQDVPRGSGAIKAGRRNAFHRLVSALIRTGCMEEQRGGNVSYRH